MSERLRESRSKIETSTSKELAVLEQRRADMMELSKNSANVGHCELCMTIITVLSVLCFRSRMYYVNSE
jgi:hypothetical protein